MAKKTVQKAAARRRGSRAAGGAGMRRAGPPQPVDEQGRLSVLIEFRQLPGASASFALNTARGFGTPGFELDEEFEPVRLPGMIAASRGFGMEMGPGAGYGMAAVEETYVIRGTVRSQREADALKSRPDVAAVWPDAPIAPFPAADLRAALVDPQPSPAAAICPIPPCDCSPGTAKGTIADVAAYLGADRIWAAGVRGTGMVVGVVDSGITAQGRPVKSGETSRRIPRVIGGWPTADWGTESGQWGEHGNMCATDVLGMAPDAQLYDLRVAGAGGSPGTISRALQAFNWAISQHRLNGTPHVLTNSWGIFQETWDTTYARNPNHPFTRKVVEAINEGILVLFAAGNCGDTCPDGRCGPDVGSGRSIWGANGHPMVMTVGAVNKNEQFIGYSSRGPAALDPNKPDFCSISHFAGYFASDSGTSAATPILAGVVALLKQAAPAATQDGIKAALRATAKDIGPAGFDIHSGAGIVQGHAAFLRLTRPIITVGPGCPNTQPPICGFVTQSPLCPVTQPPGCSVITATPACRTQPPICVQPTQTPGCGLTQPPGCAPITQPPRCPRTAPPLCTPVTLPAQCGVTLPPGCGVPRPTLACPRPTLGCFAPGDPTQVWGQGGGYPYPSPYGQYGAGGYDPWAAYYGYGYGEAWSGGEDPYGGAGQGGGQGYPGYEGGAPYAPPEGTKPPGSGQ
jgi:subtilisin family serine protease